MAFSNAHDLLPEEAEKDSLHSGLQTVKTEAKPESYFANRTLPSNSNSERQRLWCCHITTALPLREFTRFI